MVAVPDGIASVNCRRSLVTTRSKETVRLLAEDADTVMVQVCQKVSSTLAKVMVCASVSTAAPAPREATK